jgi:hypothetical protein
MKDLELLFLDKKSMSNVSSNPSNFSDTIDFKVSEYGRGRTAFVFITSHEDTVSSGNPEMSFFISTSDKDDLSDAVDIPLSLPPVLKGTLKAGKTIYAPLPMNIKQFVRLKLVLSAGSITSLKWSAGITLIAQTNSNDIDDS